MDKIDIIKSLSSRGNGDIYLGVVGAVRTGKSSFIKKVVETLIVPNIQDEYEKKRTLDELPQSAQGKTIMTTEPKFIPSSSAKLEFDTFDTNVKLVDCVGYVIPNAKGYEDENGPRMVKTPWYDDSIPFVEAAEIGTEKVIKDHSTIGIVVTTDGSIGEFSRDDYKDAEEKVINELKEIGKPFIVVLNSTHPMTLETQKYAEKMNKLYGCPVIPVNVLNMNEKDMYEVLREALYEFPVIDVIVNMPEWIAVLSSDNNIKKSYIEAIRKSVINVNKLRDVATITDHFKSEEFIENAYLSDVNTETGEVTINLTAPAHLYNTVLRDVIDINIDSKASLLKLFQEFKEAKNEYDQIKSALKQVKKTGYGVATPSIYDMKLETPEIIKQGSRYGVKLKAVAPSIHMIRVDVESTFEPIIGSETQSQELIDYLMKDYENNKANIWSSEIFGRSLDNIVNEGIYTKLAMLPDSTRYKLQNIINKMVNRGSNKLIAIVL
ncbi:MAG: stage IV sporulation protein A [Bacilli bacterium]